MKDAIYVPLNERNISRLENAKDSWGSKSSNKDTKFLSDGLSISIGSKH